MTASLLVLLLATVLPLLVFGVGAAHLVLQQQKDAMASALAGNARALQLAVHHILASNLSALEVLAADAGAAPADPASWRERARRVVGVHPEWRNAALINTDAAPMRLLASAVPAPAVALPLPLPVAGEVAEVLQTQRARVAGVQHTAQLLGQPGVLLLAPVRVSGQDRVSRVLAVALHTDALGRIFTDPPLPAGWTGRVIDPQLHLAARSATLSEAQAPLDLRVTGELAEHLSAQAHALYPSAPEAGMPLAGTPGAGEAGYTVYSRSASSGWTVALGLPAAAVNAPARDTVWMMAGAGTLMALLVLGVSGIGVRAIAQRRSLREQALNEELATRRAVEAELSASQQRLRDFSISSADWFWESDAQHRFIFLSDNFEAIVGRKRSDLLGRTRSELLSQGGLNAPELVTAHLDMLARRQAFRAFEYRLLDNHGEDRWLSVSGVPVHDDSGAFAGYRGVGQDVTVRRQAEWAVEQGHRLLREAVDNVASGFTIYDADDRLVICNATYLEIYSTSRDLIVPGARFEDIVRQGALRGQYPQANGRVDEWVAERVRLHQHPTGLPIEQELDGGRWLLIVETRTPSGYIVGNRIDITDRKRAEAEVRKLSLAVEQSPVSIYITDPAGRIEYANQAFHTVSGYHPHEVLGQTPFLLRSGLTPESTYQALRASLAQGQTWSGEFQNRRKDGSLQVVATTISPLLQTNGRLSHYVAIAQDVTDSRRQAEELERHRHQLESLVEQRTAELAGALQAAQAANQAKSQFLANMSHEIRTPLNAISGLSHLIRRSGVEPEQAQRLAKIESASRHLVEIISAILDLSKIEAGRLELDLQEINLPALVGTVIAMVSVEVATKQLHITTEIEPQAWRLLGDSTRLQQALLNYVANAVKFTPAGTVHVAVRGEQQDDTSTLLRFEVSDTGVGISAQDQDDLFTAFQQADNSSTRQHGGTGLGLAITRRFAELMGGSAGLHSQLGQGSTFWFTARLHKAGPAPSDGAADAVQSLSTWHADAIQPQPDFGGRRVLLVEDNPVNQVVMVELLDDLGLQVDVAEDGLAAVDLAAAGHYDLLLMDMQMPRLSGVDATRRIRALPGWADVPILAVTANAFVEDRARCLEAGMNDFITKPVEPGLLAATVARWLRPGISA
ncbi:MAG: hypothetical protein RIQ60_2339 [Pseudomonadota bacterium]|jgi:PAS domain S-box-containing protein